MKKYCLLALVPAVFAIAYIFRKNRSRHRVGFYFSVTEPNLLLFYSYVLWTAVIAHLWMFGTLDFGLKPLIGFVAECAVSFWTWVILYGCLEWVATSRLSYACYKRLIGDRSPMPPRSPRVQRRAPYEHSSVRVIITVPLLFMVLVAVVALIFIESTYDSLVSQSQGKLAAPILPSF